MKMLLHLMAKDFRYSRVSILFLWICVAVVAIWPAVVQQFEMPRATMMVPVMGFLWSLGFMMTLLLNWIHLDHPLATDGFLQTRPVSGAMRWLPKFLLWGTLVVGPGLAGVMLQMLLFRLDLRGEDYLRAELKAVLIVIGCFGTTAAIAAVTRRGLLALGLSIPMALMVMTLLSAYNQPALGQLSSSDHASLFELIQSRKWAAGHLCGLAGFVVAAWLLARGKGRSLTLGLIAVVLVCGSARALWPVNLIRRNALPVVADPVRLQELKSQTRVAIKGNLYEHKKRPDEHFSYHSDPLSLELPKDALEWPRLISYSRTTLPGNKSPTGGGMARADVWIGSATGTGRLNRRPEAGLIPERALLRLLGLPKNLNFFVSAHDATASAAVATPAVELNLMTPLPLSAGASVPLDGTLICEWYRPAILAELPLRAGASFTQDGNSVQVLEARVAEGILALTLRTIRHEALMDLGATDFDKMPDFHFSIANPGRGQMAVRRSLSTQRAEVFFGAAEVKATAEYVIKGAGYKLVQADQAWLETAKLYIVQARPIGRTEQACQGELTVQVAEQKP